jgi:stage III sporulation protein AD
VIVIYLKNIDSNLYQPALIVSGVLVLSVGFEYFVETFEFINKIIELTKIDLSLYKIIFKITAIGYIVEFSANLIEDFGLKSISDKLILCGKFLILSTSLPVLYAVFNLLLEVLS